MVEFILVTILKTITFILVGCIILVLLVGFNDSVQQTIERKERLRRRLEKL